MNTRIAHIECFLVVAPQEIPYLGPLAPGETVNRAGYFTRKGNGTIYPLETRSVLLRVTTEDGQVGWGETYGLTAPKVIGELMRDLIAPVVEGRDPLDVEVIWEDLYDLLRVRGYIGGFYLDALAALDIALWDLAGKITGQPICRLLGGRRRERIPVYASGLPKASLAERVELARDLSRQGFDAIKFAAAVSHEGVAAEMAALRQALPDTTLMVDLHWKYEAAEAVSLIQAMTPHRLAFAEAPCKPEDITGLAWVADHVGVPIAAGEEWRTVYDAVPRLASRAVAIVQPEMGHTGVTQFRRICALAEAHHLHIAPHSTIGCGVFLAASLQVSASLRNLRWHEHQHSLFQSSLRGLDGDLTFADGAYVLPSGPGLGVAPTAEVLQAAQAI